MAGADPAGSQVNFYYGAPAPYAESIAPSHHSTYAHYYDDEEDGWEMPNFYNETYMKGADNRLLFSWIILSGFVQNMIKVVKNIIQGKKDIIYYIFVQFSFFSHIF